MRVLRQDEMARDPETLTITDALKSFKLAMHKLAPTTLDGYCIYIARYADWLDAEGRKPVVANVEVGLVDGWLTKLKESTSPQTGKKYSVSYLLNAWAALRKFAKFLADREILSAEGGKKVSVLASLEMPQGADDARRELVDAELDAVLEAAKRGPCGERNHAALLCDAGGGFRRTELLGARLGDINWDGGYVTMRRTTTKGKTRRTTERKVGLDEEVLDALDRYIQGTRPGDPDDGEGQLFLTEDGRPMTPSALNRLYRNIKRDTGIKRFCLHVLRHTWATNKARVGTDSLDLMREGGWRDRRSMERYVHDIPDEERRARPSPLGPLQQYRERHGRAAQPRRRGVARRARPEPVAKTSHVDASGREEWRRRQRARRGGRAA